MDGLTILDEEDGGGVGLREGVSESSPESMAMVARAELAALTRLLDAAVRWVGALELGLRLTPVPAYAAPLVDGDDAVVRSTSVRWPGFGADADASSGYTWFVF